MNKTHLSVVLVLATALALVGGLAPTAAADSISGGFTVSCAPTMPDIGTSCSWVIEGPNQDDGDD